MSKLDSPSPSWILSPASLSGSAPVRRLLVLVPTDADYTTAAQRVWELANVSQSHVQFLGLCSDPEQESSLHRELITLAALVQHGNVCAGAWIEFGSNWLSAIKSTLQDGDMIVCLGEQRTGFMQRPLRKILESSLNVPVYVIPDVSAGPRPRPKWLSQAAVWTGSLAIIAFFTMFQVKIESLSEDWAQTTLMILSVLAEGWLIWTWDRLFD